MREWPSIAASVTRSTPAIAALVAQVCRRSYSLNVATLQRLTVAVCAAFTFTIAVSVLRPGKRYSSLIFSLLSRLDKTLEAITLSGILRLAAFVLPKGLKR